MANVKFSAIAAASAIAGANTVIGVQSGTTDVQYTFTNLAAFVTGGGVLAITAAKTFTVTNTLTLSGTDGSTLNIGSGGTLGSNAFNSTAYLPLSGGTLTGNLTISGASLITSGSISAAAWTTSGLRAIMNAASYTDTSSSGTVANAYTDLFGASTILASSATTYTNYYGAYFKAPVASTNVTMTNKSALGADSISIGGAAQGTNALAVTGTSAFSAALTETATIAAVSTDGLVLANNTAAANNAQQWSPRLHFIGQGFKSNVTTASQTQDWIVENVPLQSGALAGTQLLFSSQSNGSGYTKQFALTSASDTSLAGINVSPAGGLVISNATIGIAWFTTANDMEVAFQLNPRTDGAVSLGTIPTGGFKGGWSNLFLSTAAAVAFNNDTFFSRVSAGVAQVGTANNNALGSLNLTNLTGTGTIIIGTADATTSTGGALQVTGGASVAKRFWLPAITASSGLQTAVLCQSSGGEVIADSVACLASSARFKDMMGKAESGALNKIIKVPIQKWKYRREPDSVFPENYYSEHIGPTAEDIEAIDSRLVGRDKEGKARSISTEQLLALAIQAIQEQQIQIDELKVLAA